MFMKPVAELQKKNERHHYKKIDCVLIVPQDNYVNEPSFSKKLNHGYTYGEYKGELLWII